MNSEQTALMTLERPTLEQALDACFRLRRMSNGDISYALRLSMAIDQLERAWGRHNGEIEYRSWFKEAA